MRTTRITKQKIISRVRKETGMTIDMFRQTQSWVMVYDVPEKEIYETRTVYVMWLNDMSLEKWVSEGRSFAQEMMEKLT